MPEVFGTWKYDHSYGTVTDDEGETIATVETGHAPHGNAIAAMPKLLEIVQTMYKWWGLGEPQSHDNQAPIHSGALLFADDRTLAEHVKEAIEAARA